MDMSKAQRPLEALKYLEERYPKIWKLAAFAYTAKSDPDIGGWPSYCWIPMAAWRAIVGGDVRVMPLAAAAGTWRLSKGIYSFDDDLARELMSTPMSEVTPTTVFRNLPEFCVYIDTPWNKDHCGVFAHLEYDIRPNPKYSSTVEPHSELRMLYLARYGDILKGSWPFMLHIDNHNIIRSLQECYGTKSEEILYAISDELSLLLYLCSEAPDYGDRTPPKYVEPKRIKGGYKWIPKQRPEEWNIGVRLGAAIRNYKASEAHAGDGEPTGRSVRPHIRRAHWHGYWTGPRKEPAQRKFVHKWIPPIPVNVTPEDDGELPAVIRDVK